MNDYVFGIYLTPHLVRLSPLFHFSPSLEALRANPVNFYAMWNRGQVSVSSIVSRLAVQWQPGQLVQYASYDVRTRWSKKSIVPTRANE